MASESSIPLWLERTELLLGTEPLRRIMQSHLLIVGLGGVGGKACELLARAGVGRLTLIDHDAVDETNINRQVIAYQDTVGKSKADLVRQMALRINPSIKIEAEKRFLTEGSIPEVLSRHRYDYVLDCIDTLTPKCRLIYHAHELSIPLISAMGAGAKLDPEAVSIAPLGKTRVCTLARSVRQQLRRMGAPRELMDTPCVFSTEPIHAEAVRALRSGEQNKRSVVGTVSYMPQLFGLLMSAHVLRSIASSSTLEEM